MDVLVQVPEKCTACATGLDAPNSVNECRMQGCKAFDVRTTITEIFADCTQCTDFWRESESSYTGCSECDLGDRCISCHSDSGGSEICDDCASGFILDGEYCVWPTIEGCETVNEADGTCDECLPDRYMH